MTAFSPRQAAAEPAPVSWTLQIARKSVGVVHAKGKRRAFTEEFNAQTVRLVRASGESIGAIARELDLGDTVLRNWIRQAEIDAGRARPGALTTDEREEWTRLRQDVRTLRMEQLTQVSTELGQDHRLRVVTKPDPALERSRPHGARHPSAICCSDLHLYQPRSRHRIGSTFDHGVTGVVEEIGHSVRTLDGTG